MQYRTLGTTNLRVSIIGVGTWQFGGEWGKQFTQDEATAILSRAKELGINLIDTAECYGDHLSESLIGPVIEQSRKDWIVATKFGHKFHGYLDRTEPRKPADVTEQLHSSLKSLRTDYVDIYQYHSWGNKQFFDEDVQAVLLQHKAQGKIRHLGNSVSPNDNVKQIKASQEKQIEVVQIIYNRLDRAPEKTTFPICQQQHLGVLARVPLASGFLSGKYKPGATFAPGDHREKRSRADLDAKLREVEQIQKSEVPPSVKMATWALAWCLKNPVVTAVIPGCKDVGQVEANAKAADMVQ
jgi:myo-inositol catabolism protein IolS